MTQSLDNTLVDIAEIARKIKSPTEKTKTHFDFSSLTPVKCDAPDASDNDDSNNGDKD